MEPLGPGSASVLVSVLVSSSAFICHSFPAWCVGAMIKYGFGFAVVLFSPRPSQRGVYGGVRALQCLPLASWLASRIMFCLLRLSRLYISGGYRCCVAIAYPKKNSRLCRRASLSRRREVSQSLGPWNPPSGLSVRMGAPLLLDGGILWHPIPARRSPSTVIR